MKCSRIGDWLRTKSPLVTLVTVAPLVIVILGLTACVKHPIGDPEKSKVDADFSGVWGEEGSLWIFRPYDSRTYFVTELAYHEKEGKFEPERRSDFKAWLTPVGDATFITMEPLNIGHYAGVDEKPPFLVARIALVNGDLQLRLVDGSEEPAKHAESSSELEAVIRDNVSSDSLYAGDASPLKKIDDKKLIRTVLEAFPAEFPD